MKQDWLSWFCSIVIITLVLFIGFSKKTYAETNTVSTVSSTVSSNTVDKAPPSAISPGISIVNSDVCVSAYSGSVTTQILGVSTGVTVSDENCVRIKLSRQMMALNLKVPAVAILAQDSQVFDALWMSGVYPPIEGKIAADAKEIWLANIDMMPEGSKIKEKLLNNRKKEPKEFSDAQNVALFKGLFLITTGLLLF
jgi:hypothetical protein|tara:strand:+ start:10 stop:597 length:588 start_codon:yes stop_codon:yes gene_type:complete